MLNPRSNKRRKNQTTASDVLNKNMSASNVGEVIAEQQKITNAHLNEAFDNEVIGMNVPAPHIEKLAQLSPYEQQCEIALQRITRITGELISHVHDAEQAIAEYKKLRGLPHTAIEQASKSLQTVGIEMRFTRTIILNAFPESYVHPDEEFIG